ncbi:hypothetical protein BH20ACT18_BH20ACT18_06060 [soil metagenome]
MPTTRKRHAITETPPVQEALDELRREQADHRVELAELVILGAREKVARLRAQSDRSRGLRDELADMVRTGAIAELMDHEAAEEVRRRGWTRE